MVVSEDENAEVQAIPEHNNVVPADEDGEEDEEQYVWNDI